MVLGITTLAIEASNPSAGPGSVAIGASGRVTDHLASENSCGPRVLGVETLREATRHDDDLMPAIDRLVRRLGLLPRDIGRVAVSVGPGGYTAVRTAVATGKMIAEATGGGGGARCVAVPTSLVAARHAARTPGGFVVCLASKGEATHATRFDDMGRMTPMGLIDATHVASLNVRRVIGDTFLPPAIAAAAAAAGIAVEPLHLDASACYEASLALPEIDPLELLPLYPREPDAVTQWRQRSANSNKS